MNLEAMKKQMLAKAAVKRENAQLKSSVSGNSKLAPLDQDRVLCSLEFMIMIQTFEQDLQLTEEGSPEYDVLKIALSEGWNNLKASTPKGTDEYSHIYYTIFQTYAPQTWFHNKDQKAYDARIEFLEIWHETLKAAIEKKEAATYASDPAEDNEDDGDNREPHVMDNLHRMRAREDVSNTGLTWDGYEDEISERTSEVASMFSALVVPDVINF